MTTSYPWTGVLCKVRAASSQHLVLALSPLAPLPHDDLPLPLVSTFTSDDQPTQVGDVERVWLDGDVVWATGTIQLDPTSPLGERLLSRAPQPVGVRVTVGEVDEQDAKWWHHIDRRLGNNHPKVQVHTGWSLAAVDLVQTSTWPDAFITLDDPAPSESHVSAGRTPTRE